MDIETLKAYALSKPSTTFDFPFDTETMVIRVKGKIFALFATTQSSQRVNLKCDPAWAEALRQTYPAVTVGYHMSRRHWNTVLFDGSVPDDEILEMLDHSYQQVIKGLPKKDREALHHHNP